MGIIISKNYDPPGDPDRGGKPYQGFGDCGCGCKGAGDCAPKAMGSFGDAWSYGLAPSSSLRGLGESSSTSAATWILVGLGVAYFAPSILALVGVGTRRLEQK